MAEDNQPGEGELLAVPAAMTQIAIGGHLASWFAHRSHVAEEVEHSCAQFVRDGSWDAHNDDRAVHMFNAPPTSSRTYHW